MVEEYEDNMKPHYLRNLLQFKSLLIILIIFSLFFLHKKLQLKREIMKVIESLCSLVALNTKLIPNRIALASLHRRENFLFP
jgi:hypothetical protein